MTKTTVKQTISDIILKVFPNGFIDNKNIIIPVKTEDNDEVQIKITLTQTKNNIENIPTTYIVENQLAEVAYTAAELEDVKKLKQLLGI